jgi:hypothetical protein
VTVTKAGLPVAAGLHRITAVHVGSSLAYTDEAGAPQEALYLGDDLGNIFVNGPITDYPNFSGKPWQKLPTIPPADGGATPEPIVSLMTARRRAGDGPNTVVPALVVATPHAVYRMP